MRWTEFLSDGKGALSHARLIALLVGFSATAFMWKLTIMGQLTPEFFLYYLGYGVIHLNVSKFLDVLLVWRGNEAASKMAVGRAEEHEAGPSPKK